MFFRVGGYTYIKRSRVTVFQVFVEILSVIHRLYLCYQLMSKVVAVTLRTEVNLTLDCIAS
ncbi:hypothetical protein D3C80_1874280 [compost metagenome]